MCLGQTLSCATSRIAVPGHGDGEHHLCRGGSAGTSVQASRARHIAVLCRCGLWWFGSMILNIVPRRWRYSGRMMESAGTKPGRLMHRSSAHSMLLETQPPESRSVHLMLHLRHLLPHLLRHRHYRGFLRLALTRRCECRSMLARWVIVGSCYRSELFSRAPIGASVRAQPYTMANGVTSADSSEDPWWKSMSTMCCYCLCR